MTQQSTKWFLKMFLKDVLKDVLFVFMLASCGLKKKRCINITFFSACDILKPCHKNVKLCFKRLIDLDTQSLGSAGSSYGVHIYHVLFCFGTFYTECFCKLVRPHEILISSLVQNWVYCTILRDHFVLHALQNTGMEQVYDSLYIIS